VINADHLGLMLRLSGKATSALLKAVLGDGWRIGQPGSLAHPREIRGIILLRIYSIKELFY
jgi:hypothetical protein